MVQGGDAKGSQDRLAIIDGWIPTIWAGYGQSLSRFDGMAWTEFRPLEVHLADRSAGEANVRALRAGPDGTLWAVIEMSHDHSALETYLIRYARPDWSVFPLSDLAPGSVLWADEIAVDRDGSVVLVIGPGDGHAPALDPSAEVFVFDGRGMSRLGRLPWDLRFQSVEVADDGSVWLVGRHGSGRNEQRLYRIPKPEAAT